MSPAAPARGAWRNLTPEHRYAAGAAIGLVLALFLPWYEKNAFVLTDDGRLVGARENLSAFQVISYVEGAVILVAAGVLGLIYMRARRIAFRLPGGDGPAIAVAGAWALALLIWRLFDKPDVTGRAVTVGVQWGWFVAVVLATALVIAGLRLRAARAGRASDAASEPSASATPADQSSE